MNCRIEESVKRQKSILIFRVVQIMLPHISNWSTSILDHITEGVIITDADRNIQYINKFAAATLFISSEEALGMPIYEWYNVTNDIQQSILSHQLDSIGKSKQSHDVNVILINAEQQELFINQRIIPIVNGDEIEGFQIIFKNLTKENTLQKDTINKSPIANLPINTEDHSKFYRLAESSPDLIYIIDIQKRSVVYFNRSELFGYNSKQLETSDGWIAIVHPDDIKQVKAHWNKFIKTAQDSESIEYRIKRKNDEYEWVLNRHSILERSADNQPLTILLNITIITDRKKAEQSLKESEARLLALIENTHDLIWSIDSDYNFTALNSAFKNIFKNTYKCIIEKGNNLMDCLPEKLNIEWLQLHKRALKGDCFTTDFKISHKKNEQYFEVEFNPIHNLENDITGVSVFARNVSLRKKVEHEIIRTNFELDSFVYRASHDLRAPLRSVLGLINIIKTEEKADQRLTYLGLVDKSINKLDSFISDLTNFSRNSRLEIKHEKINFQEILTECIDNLKYMDQAAIVDVKIDIQHTIDFYSDPIRLGIIFQNLLSNSIKYHNPRIAKPEVLVKIVVTSDFCNIAIEDNGIGIKEQYMNQIFNMFFRATNDSYGSGLGLYITKQVVEKLKGIISVSSSAGLGTMFNIKFSIKKSSQITPNLDI